jgi:CheY-like chemotaxis protein
MAPDPAPPADDRGPVIDSFAFAQRLGQEVARVRRSGGFLSLAVFRAQGAAGLTDAEQRPGRASELLRRSIRLQDVLARRSSSLLLLMPDTTQSEGVWAAERLLAVLREDAAGPGVPEPAAAAGVATAYGEVEGGAAALLAAAEEAAREAEPGRVVRSLALQGRPRILVVDDDLSFAQALSDTISEHGWEAHPCADVADARQRARDTSYSGFFIDLMLARRRGVEILREALTTDARRPAVLMSSLDAGHELILDALSLGPVMFVRKPMTLSDVESALQMFRELVPGVSRHGRTAF